MKKKTRIVTEKKVDETAASTEEQNTSPTSKSTQSTQGTDSAQNSSDTDTTSSTTDTKSDSVSKKDTPETSSDTSTDKDLNANSEAEQTQSSDKSDTPNNSDANKAQEPVEANTESSNSNKSGKLALVISLIALGAVGFQFYQSQQNSAQNEQIASLKSELSASIAAVSKKADDIKSTADTTVGKAQSTLAEVKGNLEKLKAAESQKSSDIDALQQRLTKSIQQVENSSLQQNTRKDWLLAEVEYLLRLANQRVLMENTPVGALALLKSADKILQQTDDVSIFSVRKALAADMSALAAVPHIDQEGMYLKIDALSDQINNLKLVPITDKKKLPKIIDEVATEAVKDAQDEESSFSKAWSKASAKLEKLIVISRRDSAIEPLLSPAQQAGLLQNLHILFEQTQLSLLQRKQAPYLRSIEKAEAIIKTYFQAKDGTTVALLNGLQELKAQKVSVDLPSIAGSLNTLKAYLKQSADLKAGAQG